MNATDQLMYCLIIVLMLSMVGVLLRLLIGGWRGVEIGIMVVVLAGVVAERILELPMLTTVVLAIPVLAIFACHYSYKRHVRRGLSYVPRVVEFVRMNFNRLDVDNNGKITVSDLLSFRPRSDDDHEMVKILDRYWRLFGHRMELQAFMTSLGQVSFVEHFCIELTDMNDLRNRILCVWRKEFGYEELPA